MVTATCQQCTCSPTNRRCRECIFCSWPRSTRSWHLQPRPSTRGARPAGSVCIEYNTCHLQRGRPRYEATSDPTPNPAPIDPHILYVRPQIASTVYHNQDVYNGFHDSRAQFPDLPWQCSQVMTESAATACYSRWPTNLSAGSPSSCCKRRYNRPEGTCTTWSIIYQLFCSGDMVL